jgi:glycerophosphoryl diester phosphodiesterase
MGGIATGAGARIVSIALALGCAQASPTTPAPSAGPVGRTLDVQGHRGARGLRPENTLPAFAHALALGVSTLELDLHLSRDGKLVVVHDASISPGLCLDSHGAAIPLPAPRLVDLDLERIQQFDCGSSNPDPVRFPEPPRRNVPGAHIPTLAEVFSLVAEQGNPRVRFNLEVKTDPGASGGSSLERAVALTVEAIQRHGLLERSTLQSFDWRALRIAKTLAPELRTSALLGAPDTLGPAWQNGLELADYGSVLRLLLAARAYVDDFSPYWGHLVSG